MNCLRPLITHSPFCFTARVCIAASGTLYGSQRSEAPRGSVRQWASKHCGSAISRLNNFSCRCRGARLRSSTDTFQFCTSLSARPESPRAISSAISAKVCTSLVRSSSMPPNSSGTPSVRMPTFSAPSRISGGSRSSGVIDHSRCQLPRMKGMMTSSTKSRQLCRIRRCSSESSDIEASSDPSCPASCRASTSSYLQSVKTWMAGTSPAMTARAGSGRLAAGQKFAHAVERFENVLGRVGVGHAHIAFAEHAEIRAADQRDAGVFQERVCERLGLPAGALDVGKGVERALRRRARRAGKLVQAGDDDFAPLIELGDHFRRFVLRTGEGCKAGILRRGIDAGMQVDRELARIVVKLSRPYRIAEPPAGHGV